jgi:hypothetical protein
MKLTPAERIYRAAKLEEAAGREKNRDAQRHLLDTVAMFRALAGFSGQISPAVLPP